MTLHHEYSFMLEGNRGGDYLRIEGDIDGSLVVECGQSCVMVMNRMKISPEKLIAYFVLGYDTEKESSDRLLPGYCYPDGIGRGEEE